MELQIAHCEPHERGSKLITNPMIWACWTDEDYVGKVARVVRRINAGRLVAWSCFTRCLMQYDQYFSRLGRG